MSSIVGEKKFKNAADTSSGGWAVTDKIFGYLDKAGNIYNKVRYPQPGDPDYIEAEARLRAENAGLFGLQKPWGIVILIGGVGLLGWGLYRIAK
jgi:hypothetical protein